MRGVPFDEWVETISRSALNSADPETIPAIKLLDFYRNAARVELKDARMLTSEKAQEASKTLRHMEAVNQTWIRTWMQQWGLVQV